MSIKRIKIQNLLSFGPKGIDLELKPLNVLIGPNGCGKSNLLAAISLFQAAPTDIGKPIKESDGIKNWLWKRDTSLKAYLETEILISENENLVHSLTIGSEEDVFAIIDEMVKSKQSNLYSKQVGEIPLNGDDIEKLNYLNRLKDKSFLSQSPYVFYFEGEEDLPTNKHFLYKLKISNIYSIIRIYREYRFGVKNTLRIPQVIDRNNRFLNDDLSNLFSILHNLKSDDTYDKVKGYLSDLNQDYTGYDIVQDDDDMFRFYMLENDERVPISRLSEGTIRYLCLIAILCNKYKPVLCCIEEPELGMHGDLILTIGKMINEYKNENSKLIVTTHSSLFIDCIEPEDVIVCEKHDGETTMERLDGEYLKEWLKDYTLGHVWSSGQIGGNRW